MTEARLYTDGLYWHYNPNRMILNKATDVFLVNNQEERVELEDEKLYLVVTDYYNSQMLVSVTDLSMGLLSIVPKFADGTPIENYEDVIIMKGDQELKAWVAIADYMSSFEDTDGDGIADYMDECPNTPAHSSWWTYQSRTGPPPPRILLCGYAGIPRPGRGPNCRRPRRSF